MALSVSERCKTGFFFRGGETGCLLLHGFAGSPGEVELLGKELAGIGFTTLAPLLAGHACVSEMECAGWKDWRQSAFNSYLELSDCTKQVYIVGFSLGGLIAYDLAATEHVAGVVSINTPIRLVLRQELRGQLLKKARTGVVAGTDDAPTIDRVPMSCLSAMYDYTVRVEGLLPQVSVPSLIIQAKHDESVNPGDSKLIKDSLGSRQKRIVWVDSADHLSLLEEKASQVAKEIEAFIRETTSAPGLGDEK